MQDIEFEKYIIYDGQQWQRIPELDAEETIAIQNEYGEIKFIPKSQAIVKKYTSKESSIAWWILAAIGLALI